jgi:hypothetical protein
LGIGFKWVEPVGYEVVLIWLWAEKPINLVWFGYCFWWSGLINRVCYIWWSGLINRVCYIWMELDTIWFPAHLQAAD